MGTFCQVHNLENSLVISVLEEPNEGFFETLGLGRRTKLYDSQNVRGSEFDFPDSGSFTDVK